MPQSSSFAGKRDDAVVMVLLLVFVVGLGVCVRPFVVPTAKEASRRAIVGPLRTRQPEAWTNAQQHLRDFPEDVVGLALAAEAAAVQKQMDEAIRLFEQLPQDGGRWEFRREFALGRRYEILGQLQKSEQHLRRALQINPMHLDANELLGHILQVTGRVSEAAPHFFVQVLRGRCNVDELLCLPTAELFFRREPRLEGAFGYHTVPDLLMTLAAARSLRTSRKTPNKCCVKSWPSGRTWAKLKDGWVG